MSDRWLERDERKLSSQVLLTFAASMAGKLLGFVRLQQIASTLGVSIYSDAVLVAMQLVWLLETVFISSAVMPVLVSRVYQVDAAEGGDAAIRFWLHAALICTLVASGASALAIVFSESLAVLIAPGFDEYGIELFSTLLLASAATPVGLALAHFLGLVNRLLNNAVWYSVPQIVTNLAAIAGLLIGFYHGGAAAGAFWMMAGMAIGAYVVCILQFWVIPRAPKTRMVSGIRKSAGNALGLRAPHGYWHGVLALALVALLNELYVYVDFYFASKLSAGSVSLLGFASRLAALANMLVVGSALVITEPRWAHALADRGQAAWRSIIGPDIVALLGCMAIPMVLLYSYPEEITRIVYNSGSFSVGDRKTINALTMIFAFGSVALAVNLISTRVVVLMHRHRWIFIISAIVLPAKIFMSASLVGEYGVLGLAAATVVATVLQSFGNLVVIALHLRTVAFPIADVARLLCGFGLASSVAYVVDTQIGGGILGLIIAGGGVAAAVLAFGLLGGFGRSTFFNLGISRN
ncbi:hypothetical protein GRI72_08215 [Altererythrobacter marinus]|uniref:Polysaccharide biosynthesis protein n=2 Tax=Pelagerythrobacter marinus TaxID=538382 RepID=A0ABW9UWI1_9SPHN|nr:hypothetical protein [Pelagerythrobacter marinus]